MIQDLYKTDFNSWIVAQTNSLRNGDIEALDLDNLIEEIESMASSEERELHSRFVSIMAHMLKLMCEPTSYATSGWRKEIDSYRASTLHILKRQAKLKAHAQDFVDDAYQIARLEAVKGSECSVDDFPDTCPWTAEQLFQKGFYGN